MQNTNKTPKPLYGKMRLRMKWNHYQRSSFRWAV